LQEFISNPNDPRWEEIAKKGRRHTLDNLNNDRSVESLIEVIEEVIH
jgi:hypothetical protein